MPDYDAITANARAKVEEYGSAVTFVSPSGSGDIAGFAMQDEGDPEMYQSLGLVASQPLTLFFVPDDYAVQPSLLDRTVAWAGATYVVKHVKPFAPQGSMIYANIVVIR